MLFEMQGSERFRTRTKRFDEPLPPRSELP